MGVTGKCKGNETDIIILYIKRNRDVFNILKNYADTN